MAVKYDFDNHYLNAWLLLHQTYNLILKCEDHVFNKYEISTEQHAVLMAIKYIKSPVTPTAVARWLDRNPNSISLIVDRMSRAGLVRGVRDLRDRRAVRLVMTGKGKAIFDQATVAGWRLIQDILKSMEDEDIHTLIRLLQVVREKSFKFLNPEAVMEKIHVNETENMKRFMKKVAGYSSDTVNDESD